MRRQPHTTGDKEHERSQNLVHCDPPQKKYKPQRVPKRDVLLCAFFYSAAHITLSQLHLATVFSGQEATFHIFRLHSEPFELVGIFK
jgi:hypothetical protein